MQYRLDPSLICARLVRAYFGSELDLSLREDIWNYEVVGRVPCGEYRLVAMVDSAGADVKYSADGVEFSPCELTNGRLEIDVSVDHERLGFYVQASAGEAGPLRDLVLISPDGIDEEALIECPRRDTLLSDCNLWGERWPEARRVIESEGFNLNELPVMRDELIDWSASRQVLDSSDPHFGAIYSEEDKYCFVDAAFAALAFERRHVKTGDAQWRHRATIARDYAFRGQYRHTGDSAKDGAWASMGIIDDPDGSSFRRITDKWRQASGVDMNIICTVASQLTMLGLCCTPKQLTQLEEACLWQKRNALGPGWFSHHEGMNRNCLNVCALGASQVFAAHHMLKSAGGAGIDQGLIDDALKAYGHVISCQESIGVLPYRMGENRRGGKYWMHNLPDNGMTWYHLLRFLRNPLVPVSLEDDCRSVRRVALWYLMCCGLEDGYLKLAYDDSRECYEHSIGFGNFTWCRVTMLDVISQLWDVIGDTEFWKQFARCHLRTLRETAWNTSDNNTAPLKASVVPVRLVSWVQRAEWAAVVFDNLAARCGVEPMTADM